METQIAGSWGGFGRFVCSGTLARQMMEDLPSSWRRANGMGSAGADETESPADPSTRSRHPRKNTEPPTPWILTSLGSADQPASWRQIQPCCRPPLRRAGSLCTPCENHGPPSAWIQRLQQRGRTSLRAEVRHSLQPPALLHYIGPLPASSPANTKPSLARPTINP